MVKNFAEFHMMGWIVLMTFAGPNMIMGDISGIFGPAPIRKITSSLKWQFMVNQNVKQQNTKTVKQQVQKQGLMV